MVINERAHNQERTSFRIVKLPNQGRGEKQQVTSFNRIANSMQVTTDVNPFKHKWKSKRGDQ